MNKDDQLKLLFEVQSRMNTEVIIPFESYYKDARTGFHIILRYIFPVIEYLETITRESKYNIMQTLDIPFPRITWNLYRNSLMHSDFVHLLKLKGSSYDHLSIGWTFGYHPNSNHAYIKESFAIGINVQKLIYDLKNYCDDLIPKVSEGTLTLKPPRKTNEYKIELDKPQHNKLVAEFELIHKLYQV